MNTQIKDCKTCFMTSEFPNAQIDESGQCQWCRNNMVGISEINLPGIKYAELMEVADRIKREHTGNYDCIIGVSGGLDSSYMAYIAGKIMGLNALLVHYDHGFFYGKAKENLEALARDLSLELRVYKSKEEWDKRYVNAFIKAFSKTEFYWGICTFCHYILPATIVKVGLAEGIKFYMSHSNKYELSLKVPRQTKLKAMLQGIVRAGILHIPATIFYFLLAQYYLLRLKLEFYTPPLKNIFRGAPQKPFKTINLTKYVPWDIKQMVADLTRDTGWRLLQHPSLGMRFDCIIEDSYMNTTYKQATGATVHAIIANNLIYDGVQNKLDLTPAVAHYDAIIDDRMEEVMNRVLH